MNEAENIDGKEYDVAIQMITDKSVTSAKALSLKLGWEKSPFKKRKRPLAIKKMTVKTIGFYNQN